MTKIRFLFLPFLLITLYSCSSKYDAIGDPVAFLKTTIFIIEEDGETYTSYTYNEYNNWTGKKTLNTDYEEIIERKIEYYK